MRNLAFALMLAAPISAFAQTPADVTHLARGDSAASLSSSVAPDVAAFAGGALTASSLAQGASFSAGRAPAHAFDVASGPTGRDLARLLGATRPAIAVFETPASQASNQPVQPRG